MTDTQRLVLLTVFVGVLIASVGVGTAAGQSPEIVTASGDTTTPGEQATVSVQAEDTGSVTISGIPNDWSVDSSQNQGAFVAPDGNGDSISGQGSVTWAWSSGQSSVDVSVTLNIPSDAPIQTNTLDVESRSTVNTDSRQVDVDVQQQQQPSTGTITVVTGDQGDTVEAVAQSGQGATEATGTTGANGQVDLTVDPANGPFSIVVNGNEVRTTVTVNADGTTTIDINAGGAQDPVDANGNRIVGGPGGNSATVFLSEDDIATNSGVFRPADLDGDGSTEPVAPGQFVDADDVTLSVTNGVIDQDNAVTTYLLQDSDGNTLRTLDVREPRIQGLFVVDALSNERLDESDTAEVEQTQPGDNFNIQVVADYNYFESTNVDLDDLLLRDGGDVTDIFFESSSDISIDPGGPFVSVDERQRTYDFLANFDIDETDEYTVNVEPASGDDRADGRGVGFVGREEATDSEFLRVTGANLEASGDSSPPGEQATVSVQASDISSITISNIPNSWSVEDSTNDGAFVSPDTDGDFVSSQGTVTWSWGSDQSSVSVDVTFNVPNGAPTQDNTLDVTAQNAQGSVGSTTAVVSVRPTIDITASGDTTAPGGQATVDISVQDPVGSVTVSDIPPSWSVASSQNDGAFVAPDGSGDAVSTQGEVTWIWSSDQSSADVSVTLGVPDGAQTQNQALSVEAEDSTGATGMDTATVTVQNCPFDPVVCSFDPNGDIDTGDLQDAINEFLNDNIDTSDIQEVINAFIESR